jgi:predicted nucleotidyltransferase
VTDQRALLRLLVQGDVRFIVVGGVAAVIHGSARLTLDVDVVYDRAPDNIERLAAVLAPRRPYLRGAPPGLPFAWDAPTIRRGLNFTLTTDLGDLDLLGEVAGGGSYADLLPHAAQVAMEDLRFLCVDLATLIRLKRAAGRPKDLEAVAELELLLARLRGRGPA